MTIRNPVIPGYNPDPSVCKVGEDYYLATSTFEYMPGVPIYHSKDLVNWELIGHCLTRKSQLNLDGHLPSNGVFAPTLRHHDGTFYMITTDMGGRGNFYVSATDPAGPWSEPIFVDPDMFDPSLLFDDDGKVYYTRRGNGFLGVLQAEIDIATGEFLTPLREIHDKYICADIEGPHLYKINGMYYLQAAEGGTRFGHAVVTGRSDNPWGPFEPCPHNPIITHRDKGHLYIRDTGHAELVEGPDGQWYMFCLGTRHLMYNSASVLGRETFMVPVTWTEDGWPVIENRQVPESFCAPTLAEQKPESSLWQDSFDSPKLDLNWNFIRNPHEADWSLTERPGYLRLNGSAISLNDIDSPAFVGRRQQHFNMIATAKVEFTPGAENESAGLTAFENFEHHYDLLITQREGQRVVLLRKVLGDIDIESEAIPLMDDSPVRLKIACDGHNYAFSFAQGKSNPIPVGNGLSKFISPEVAATAQYSAWTGVYLGMFASGNGKACTSPADFSWFQYRITEEA